MASNLPLAGRKHLMFEGGVRSSAFIHGAGIQSPGRVSEELMHVSDWYFSLTEAAARGIDGSEESSKASEWARSTVGMHREQTDTPSSLPATLDVSPAMNHAS